MWPHECRIDLLPARADRLGRGSRRAVRAHALPDGRRRRRAERTGQHGRQHVLALGDRACGLRRGAAASRLAGGQEPIRLAREADARRRAGDRGAASDPSVGRGHPHPAEGQYHPTGAAEMERGGERAQVGMAARGASARPRRGAVGAEPGRAARRGGARERRREMEHERTRADTEPRLPDATRARDRPAADHRLGARHAHWRNH